MLAHLAAVVTHLLRCKKRRWNTGRVGAWVHYFATAPLDLDEQSSGAAAQSFSCDPA
jgi:hypothetical protein